MNAQTLFRKKTFFAVSLLAVTALAFQNCAPPAGDEGNSSNEQTVSADHDPLKSESSVDKSVGRGYRLESFSSGDVNSALSSASSELYQLQFSGDFGSSDTSSRFSATLRTGCTSVVSASGQMSRMNGLPLRTGAIDLRDRVESEVIADDGCVDDASITAAIDETLFSVRSYAIDDSRLILTAADGRMLVFIAKTAKQNFETLVKALKGRWKVSEWSGNPCTDSGSEICSMIFLMSKVTESNQVTISANGDFEIQYACEIGRGQLAEKSGGAPLIPGYERLQMKNYKVSARTDSAAVACDKKSTRSDVHLMLSRLASASVEGNSVSLRSLGSNEVILERLISVK